MSGVQWLVECPRCARAARVETPRPASLRRWRVSCSRCGYAWRGPRPPAWVALRGFMVGVLVAYIVARGVSS